MWCLLASVRVRSNAAEQFAPVERVVRGRFQRVELGIRASGLAFHRFDLDDLGSQIGDEHTTERPGDDLGEVEDSNAVK